MQIPFDVYTRYINGTEKLDASRGTIYPFNRVKKLDWVRSYVLFFFLFSSFFPPQIPLPPAGVVLLDKR